MRRPGFKNADGDGKGVASFGSGVGMSITSPTFGSSVPDPQPPLPPAQLSNPALPPAGGPAGQGVPPGVPPAPPASPDPNAPQNTGVVPPGSTPATSNSQPATGSKMYVWLGLGAAAIVGGFFMFRGKKAA